jgi:hypothetical protein
LQYDIFPGKGDSFQSKEDFSPKHLPSKTALQRGFYSHALIPLVLKFKARWAGGVLQGGEEGEVKIPRINGEEQDCLNLLGEAKPLFVWHNMNI